MLDTLRIVSSEDVGRDEANVESLLKKHKDVIDELNNYSQVIDALHQQASQLTDQDPDSKLVKERLDSIDHRYTELRALANLRRQRLLDAQSLYKLFSEADGIEQWIREKVKVEYESFNAWSCRVDFTSVVCHRIACWKPWFLLKT